MYLHYVVGLEQNKDFVKQIIFELKLYALECANCQLIAPFEWAMLFEERRMGILIGSTAGVLTLVPVAEISGRYQIPYRREPTARLLII